MQDGHDVEFVARAGANGTSGTSGMSGTGGEAGSSSSSISSTSSEGGSRTQPATPGQVAVSSPARPPVEADWREVDEHLARLLEGDTAGVRPPAGLGAGAPAGPCPRCGYARLWRPRANPDEIRCGRCQEPGSADEVLMWLDAPAPAGTGAAAGTGATPAGAAEGRRDGV